MSRQLEIPALRLWLIRSVTPGVADRENFSRRLGHSAVCSELEKLQRHGIVAFQFAFTKGQQWPAVAITKQCDLKRRLRAIAADAHVTVLLVDHRGVVQPPARWSFECLVRQQQ